MISPVPIRILCVDYHPVVRRGIAAMLATEPQLDLVAEAASGSEALENNTVGIQNTATGNFALYTNVNGNNNGNHNGLHLQNGHGAQNGHGVENGHGGNGHGEFDLSKPRITTVPERSRAASMPAPRVATKLSVPCGRTSEGSPFHPNSKGGGGAAWIMMRSRCTPTSAPA